MKLSTRFVETVKTLDVCYGSCIRKNDRETLAISGRDVIYTLGIHDVAVAKVTDDGALVTLKGSSKEEIKECRHIIKCFGATVKFKGSATLHINTSEETLGV